MAKKAATEEKINKKDQIKKIKELIAPMVEADKDIWGHILYHLDQLENKGN